MFSKISKMEVVTLTSIRPINGRRHRQLSAQQNIDLAFIKIKFGG